jgi:acyl carrier protein
MELEQTVRQCAESLGLLKATGELGMLDSMMMIDFATALEPLMGFEIPAEELSFENFETLASVVRLLVRLRAEHGG